MSRALCIYATIASTISVFAAGFLLLRDGQRDGTAKYLVQEKVSLLDWGLEDLEKRLHRANTPLLKKHGGLAFYDASNNKIILTSSTTWEEASSRKEATEWCAGLIREMKSELSIDPGSGKPLLGDSSTVYLSFQHAGYRASQEPERLRTELDQMVLLGATVHVAGKTNELVQCQSTLLGRDIEFKDIYDRRPKQSLNTDANSAS